MLREKEGNEAKAKRMCQQKVAEHHLHMEILDAEFQMYSVISDNTLARRLISLGTGRSSLSTISLKPTSTSTLW